MKNNLLRVLENPPPEYRPFPFLVLNDEYRGAAAIKRIQHLIQALKQVGYGGFFVHPRPGLITEYLAEEWFTLVDCCLTEAKKQGMSVHIYDENSYPSGFAGGHVPAKHPESRVRYLKYYILRGIPDISRGDEIFSAYRLLNDNPLQLGERITEEELAIWTQDQHIAVAQKPRAKDPVVVFYMNQMQPHPWHGEFPYVSLVDPKVAPAFLESTHEQYRKRYHKDFGKTILSIFMDEPNLAAISSGSSAGALHISPYIFHQFSAKYGYNLKDHLAELFFNVGDFEKVRFDYYDLLHVLWAENWAKPLEAWADNNGLAQTGHYLEHEWPAPYATPGQVHMLAHMHWPGVDMLYCTMLDGLEAPWFCTQDRQEKGREPHFTMYLRQCASVANQLGKKRLLCESWGAGGNDAVFEDFKRIGDWLIVNGVNLLNPHMAMSTISGTRKTDHPQFFSDQSSWFPYLKPLNDHLSRLCCLTSQGHVENKILVLDPLTTGYLLAERSIENHLPFKPLDDSFSGLVQSLAEHHFDFDLGDEYVLEEFARVKKGRIVFSHQSYETVIWPELMVNLRDETAVLLEQFLVQGGRILSLENQAIKISGKISNRVQNLRSRFRKQWIHFKDRPSLLHSLKEIHFPSISLKAHDGSLSEGILHLRRILSDGTRLHLIVNSLPQEQCFHVECEGRAVSLLDTQQGEEIPMEIEDGPNQKCHFDLSIPGIGSRLLWVRDHADSTPHVERILRAPSRKFYFPLEIKRCQRVEPNRIVLDYCDLLPPNRMLERNLCVAHANDKIWKAHGFSADPWFRSIQYRRQNIEIDHFDSRSGFELQFHVEIKKGVALEKIELAVEHPELFQITVNGHIAEIQKGRAWQDPHLRKTCVGPLLKVGKNRISIIGKPFNIRMEPDQIYLVGDFSVVPNSTGFHLEAEHPLQLGSWKSQGLPFYDAAVDYTVQLPAMHSLREFPAAKSVSLQLGEWAGSLVEIRSQTCPLAQIISPPYEWGILPHPKRRTEITLRVVGTPKNLFGPFHDPNRMRKITGQWLNGNACGPIAGKNYDLLDYGLMTPPRLVVYG